MKEDIMQNAVKKNEPEKNEAKCSSIPKIISFSCSKCGKTLSIEETYYAVDPDKKVKNWRFEEVAFLAFFCADCFSLKKE